jgi:tetratricopeptide (TPR) repeat protein
VKPAEETPEDYLGEAQASLGHYAEAAEAYHRAMLRGHNSEESLQAWAGFALERFRQIGENLRATEAGVATVKRLQKAAAQPLPERLCGQPIPGLERHFAASEKPLQAEHLDTAFKLSVCYALQAGAAAERLQENGKDEAAVHRLRGDLLLRIKTDAAAAEGEYRKALALQPRDPALLARLAEAQASAGDPDGAKQSAQAALAIDPHRREALRTLAFVAMGNRDYDQALPVLRRIAAESPGDRSAQVEFGRALAQTGNNAEALKYLTAALAAGYPDEKGALHALEARVLRDLGRDEEAAKASAEARRLSDAFQARNKMSPGGKPDADQ